MALAALGSPFRISHLSVRRSLVFCISKVVSSSSSGTNLAVVGCLSFVESFGDGAPEHSTSGTEGEYDGKGPKWKKLSSTELGITTSMISRPIRIVLNTLKKKGYDVYLVGGCVRDLILKRIPKDFDIITSAELKEVRNAFPRSEVIGRRFPICHVHVNDTTVEVSSFKTSGRNSLWRFSSPLKKPSGCNDLDYVRWRNCLKRDFTINGLMFDPYAKIIYDYIGGMEDLRKAKVRTVIPADLSFVEDCARILRAFRVAARLGFHFTREIAYSLRELSHSILTLDKGRILMEMNYMLAFGSGEASLRLMWRFGLLELLLPIQASYFVSQGFRRRDKGSNMLLGLFANLDKVVAPDRPCHSSLWIALLAFHNALADKPREPTVVAAFALAVHSGGSVTESIKIARGISQPHDSSHLELLEPKAPLSKLKMMNEIVDLAATVKDVLYNMTNRHYVAHVMRKYPQAPRSDLVFIPEALLQRVCNIFDCVKRGMGGGSIPTQSRIDYDSLMAGNLQEVRHTFARIVFDTVYPASHQSDPQCVESSIIRRWRSSVISDEI
ncbi:hypothetical protein MLD38_028387 [Melastoma candidum]|uniref:Uncharacterized protein n=1 Tax=Melastoma candidum TaxID=119954 RepID=A0ACB9N387_9MYRT|nr:hypothetical protein MLD38_028387 [Melastoma candidum]